MAKRIPGKKKVGGGKRVKGNGKREVGTGRGKKTGAAAAASAVGTAWPMEASVTPVQVTRQVVKLDEIGFDDRNQRVVADDKSIDGLAATIATDGLLQAIRVMELDAKASRAAKGKKYQVVYGHRRVLAMRRLGWETTPADVVTIDDVRRDEQRAIENVQRADLNPMEKAVAVGQMLDARGVTAASSPEERAKAIEAVAERIGKSASWVREYDMLTRLSKKVRAMVVDGSLSVGKAVLIARLAGDQAQESLAEMATGECGVNVDVLRIHMKQDQSTLKDVPWKLDEKVGGCPPCSTCPNNSVNNRGLFESELTVEGKPPRGAPKLSQVELDVDAGIIDESGHGYCLDERCYIRKRGAVKKMVEEGVKAAVAAVKKSAKAAGKAGGAGGKAEKIAVTEKSLTDAGLVPPKVDPAAFVKSVRAEIKQDEPVQRGAKYGAKAASTPEKPRVVPVEQEANQRLTHAKEEWMRVAKKRVLDELKAVPGRIIGLAMVKGGSAGKPFHDYYYGERTPKKTEEIRRAWNSPRLLSAFASLKSPTLEGLLALERELDDGVAAIQLPGIDEGLLSLARCLEVSDIAPIPTIEAFRSQVMSERAEKRQDEFEAAEKKADKKTTADIKKSGRKKKSLAEAEKELDEMAERAKGAGGGENEPAPVAEGGEPDGI